MLIFAAPPGLPLVLMLVGAVAQSVLVKDGVLLLRPETIRPGAAVDMVCFDKTGTLTSSMVSGTLSMWLLLCEQLRSDDRLAFDQL